jgi:hypothetical protein
MLWRKKFLMLDDYGKRDRERKRGKSDRQALAIILISFDFYQFFSPHLQINFVDFCLSQKCLQHSNF